MLKSEEALISAAQTFLEVDGNSESGVEYRDRVKKERIKALQGKEMWLL